MGGSSGKGKPSGEQTVTSRTDIPEWLQGPMQEGIQGAQGLYQQGEPEFYPGQTVVPFSGQTEQALGMTEGLAGQADPFGAMQNYQGLMGGDYLYGGEGFNQALEAAGRQIQPQVASMFGRSGRNQSGLADVAATQQLGDVFAGMYGQERGRQMQGLGMAGQMDALRGMPAARMAQVGAAREAQTGREQADARARYEADAYAPQVGLDRYISRVTGIAPFGGQSSSQTSPLYNNRLAGGLGGAMSGLGMAGQLGGMPFFGAGGAGAGLGGMLGPIGLIGGGLLGALG